MRANNTSPVLNSYYCVLHLECAQFGFKFKNICLYRMFRVWMRARVLDLNDLNGRAAGCEPLEQHVKSLLQKVQVCPPNETHQGAKSGIFVPHPSKGQGPSRTKLRALCKKCRYARPPLLPYASACYPRMFLASQAAPAFEHTLPHVWYTCVHGVSITSAEERGNSTLTGSHGFYLKAMAKFLHASV